MGIAARAAGAGDRAAAGVAEVYGRARTKEEEREEFHGCADRWHGLNDADQSRQQNVEGPFSTAAPIGSPPMVGQVPGVYFGGSAVMLPRDQGKGGGKGPGFSWHQVEGVRPTFRLKRASLQVVSW